jgi:Na+/proline symporter
VFWQGPGIAVVSLYLLVLLLLGWQGYRRRREDSLGDFYLAGSSLGFVVLLSTLYASQYSGNTFLGYTGEAYRIGFAWMMSVGMMMSVIVVYLLFAPTLQILSRRHGYVTPSDWVRHRFQDRRLALLVALIMAVSLLNYLYAQFLAMGHLAYRMSDGEVPFWVGVVGLAGVIGLYETLGGMRSVAWTDVVQGAMLFLGLLLVLAVAWPSAGSLEHISRSLLERQPALVQVPSWQMCGNWASSIVLLGVGAAVYPHAIQRIYAARDATALRQSFQVMVCMPLFTTLVVFLIGILAHGLVPRESNFSTDEVMPVLLSVLFEKGTLAQWGTVTVLTAALAAIMSTADSALLSLSSILARDFVGEWRGHELDEAKLARMGKWLSWAIIVVLVVLAIRPPTTLWRLIEIKMQLLIQVAPMFIIGIRSKRLDARTAFIAVSVGSAIYLVAGALTAWGIKANSIGGVHTGTIGCAVNLGICWLGMRKKAAEIRN